MSPADAQSGCDPDGPGRARSLRALLRIAATCAAILLIGSPRAIAIGPAVSIVQENLKPGTPGWEIAHPASDHQIEGYANLTSVNRGGQISFFVSTTDPAYKLEVYRTGWYGGAGARLMMPAVILDGTPQPLPTPDPVTGLVECAWTNSYVLTADNPDDPSDWPSGVYLAKLTGEASGAQSYIIFVVRDDSQSSDLLFQTAVTTYQAYNQWGGKSLYRGTDGVPAVEVSFNRPYDDDSIHYSYDGYGLAPGAGQYLRYEYDAVRFLEREGYRVTYATSVDLHSQPSLLLLHKGFLSVGHDEYWSWEMRQGVQDARDAGVGLGFISANTCFFQVRFQPSYLSGAPDRTMICYKTPYFVDPVSSDPSTYYLMTTLWRFPHVTLPGMPEEQLRGSGNVFVGPKGDLVIGDTSSWVFDATGLNPGDRLKGLLGYEVDSMTAFSPPATQLLARTSGVLNGKSYNSDMTVYQAASGATVFGTGTIHWAWGLDDYAPPHSSLASPAVQQIMRNVLSRFISPPMPVPLPVVVLSPAELGFGPWAMNSQSPMRWASLTNDRDTAFRLARITATGDFRISSTTCRKGVEPHSKCTIALAMSARATGPRTGSLSVRGADRSLYTVQLKGIGVSAPRARPAVLSFAARQIGSQSASQQVVINNPVPGILQLNAAVTGDFVISQDACGTTLPPAGNCTIGVSFRPTASGRRTGSLLITNSANTLSVRLRGIGRRAPRQH